MTWLKFSVNFSRLLLLTVCLSPLQLKAQNNSEIERVVSNLSCLTPSAVERGSPEYPSDELNMKESAEVRVQLTFSNGSLPPKVKVLENTGVFKFADSVARFVAQYRLPCLLETDAEVVASQNFVFSPGDGRTVKYTALVDDETALDAKCLRRPVGGLRYPPEVLEENRGGNLLAAISFHQPNEEPEVRILYNARSERLASSVRVYAKGLRYTCDIALGKPVQLLHRFRFTIRNANRYAFKDFGLIEFLQSVDRKELKNGKFNFKEMGCPFDIAVVMRRPYARNVVGEYDVSEPSRRAFIEWVRGLSMVLSAESEPYLFDQQLKIAVPCMALDL